LGSFQEHIKQAKSNLKFLEGVNQYLNSFHDWQVTTSFYVAVHLINAHTAQVGQMHYQSHSERKQAINYANPLAPCRLEEKYCLAYLKLENLSRRARYLCLDQDGRMSGPDAEKVFLTFGKHFKKALNHLDTIMTFFRDKYNIHFDQCIIYSEDIKPNLKFEFFVIRNQPQTLTV
jgi:hypothetical protein